ncbi:hypothetical protein [Pseudomonas fluorescens]|uniref:Uncharacterized protein n=1 Tax=Pseudomonas fluorescens TaxID=294 RepID=A0A5E7U4X5_PSEFL|nr:hypothetical protein [Pseudomonas fluorescens]VVQ05126.1 hypothetical protein PS928_02970 [Pseudomonas fluorescens]
MNEHDELRRLAALALAGDLEALDAAVELAERLLLMQELASAPSGLRAQALIANAALWKARRQQIKKSRITIENNKRRTAKLEALVTAAIQAKRARLEKEPRHSWTSTLMVHYFDKRKITIDEETVRRVVYSFPGF